MLGRRNRRYKLGMSVCVIVMILSVVTLSLLNPHTRTLEIKDVAKQDRIEDWCPKSKHASNSTCVEDLLQYKLIFNEGFKNPCFYDHCHTFGSARLRSLRCLPYFHVLGVDKCGSTDLFSRIVQHPQIVGNKGSLGKETMWWSWKRYDFFLNRRYGITETFHDYLGYFDDAAGQILSRTTYNSESEYHPLITGDGTPMDFWDFTGWTKLMQNKYRKRPEIMTPHLMKHINPSAKFILLFRDPTDRLYSDYIFLGLGKRTPEAFHAAVEYAIQVVNNCTEEYNIKTCLFDKKIHVKLKARLHVSIYSVFLTEWFKVFPRERFLIFRTEDYSENIYAHLKRAYEFLDVIDISNETMKEISNRQKSHVTRKKSKVGPMLPKTRTVLDNFFKPYIDQLVNITKNLKFLWADTRKKRQELEKIQMKNAIKKSKENSKNQQTQNKTASKKNEKKGDAGN